MSTTKSERLYTRREMISAFEGGFISARNSDHFLWSPKEKFQEWEHDIEQKTGKKLGTKANALSDEQ